MNTTVSVIIPTFNRLSSLPQAIDSVVGQSHQAHEIIVIDDGSSDGTSSWLKRHHPDITLISQSNHGVSHARNQGIKHASGEWIALLDSDDHWFEHKLATQLSAIEAHPSFRLCHCDEHWIRNGVRVNPMRKHRKRGGAIFEFCLPLCAISPSAALLHRSLFDDFGLFDESLPACEDYDLWLRICAKEPVLYVDQALLEKTGGHSDQLSTKHWGMDRFRLHALAKLLRTGQLTPEQHTLTMATFQKKWRIQANGAKKRDNTEHLNHLEADYADLTSH